MKKLSLFFPIITIILFTGCSLGIEDKCMHKRCYKEGEKAPLWICKAKIDGMVVAVGSAETTPVGIGFQRQEAMMKVREKLSAKIKNSVKQQLLEAGIVVEDSAFVSVRSERPLESLLRNKVRGLKEWVSRKGTIYFMGGISKGNYKLVVDQLIKKKLSRSRADYNKFYKKK